jgi:hypothetical protein
MTLKPLTLEEYFHLIIKPTTQKETTMFEYLKNKWRELTTTKYEFVEESPTMYEDGYWAFEMYTPEWVDEHGDTVAPIHTVLVEPHEGTWMELLDTMLDAMEKHYGYNIKEQVYYSVAFPLNDHDDEGFRLPGYGRCLNDEILQQLLLAHPEVYEAVPFGGEAKKGIFE